MEERERGAQEWHSYRCPVCGHTDEVALEGGPADTVPCSHCSTALEVLVRSPDRAAATVKVASRWRGAR